MKRRDVFAAATAALAAPSVVRAQATAGRLPRIGYLSPSAASGREIDAFRTGMRAYGHVEGQTYTLEFRNAERDNARFGALLDELLRAGIAILVVRGPAYQIAGRAAQHVPVVFAISGDPVEAGLISSFARPGGNVTGISFLALDLVPKRLSLLKEAAPAIRRIGVISNPQHAGERGELRVTLEAARTLGVEIVYQQVHTSAEIAGALAAISRANCDALSAFPEALTSDAASELAAFAADNDMPSVFGWRNFCVAGGLMSYGPNLQDANVRMAYFVDRILRGAKPAELPAELPRAIELVINLRTAIRLGLTIPHVLISRADEVIE